MVKNLPAVQETRVQSLGWEDPLENGTAIHSSILAWRIQWTEESGRLHSMWSQRVRYHWVTNTLIFSKFYRCKKHNIPRALTHEESHNMTCNKQIAQNHWCRENVKSSQMMAKFLLETMQVRRQWGYIFKILKGRKKNQPRILYSRNLSGKNKGEKKSISDI